MSSPLLPFRTFVGWTLREQKRLRQLFQKLTVSLLHKWLKGSLFMHCSASFAASLIACYAALLPRRGRILRRTLSVRLSVRPSRYRYRASRRAT